MLRARRGNNAIVKKKFGFTEPVTATGAISQNAHTQANVCGGIWPLRVLLQIKITEFQEALFAVRATKSSSSKSELARAKRRLGGGFHSGTLHRVRKVVRKTTLLMIIAQEDTVCHLS